MSPRSRYSRLKNLPGIDLAKLKWIKDIDNLAENTERRLIEKRFPISDSITQLFDALVLSLWLIPCENIRVDWVLSKLGGVVPRFCKKQLRSCTCLGDVQVLTVLCSLRDDEENLEYLAKWHKTNQLTVFGDSNDMARQHALHQIASLYVTLPNKKIQDLAQLMQGTRSRPLTAILDAIEFLRCNEETSFFSTLLGSTSKHRHRINASLGKANYDVYFKNLIAIPESILWNIGCQRGYSPPEVPLELRPFMMVRQVLGMPLLPSQNKCEAAKIATRKSQVATKEY